MSTCDESQKGIVFEAPHRQSLILEPVASSFLCEPRSKGIPSASRTTTGPYTLYEPSGRTWISTSVTLASLAAGAQDLGGSPARDRPSAAGLSRTAYRPIVKSLTR
jgi:hypothetical protein